MGYTQAMGMAEATDMRTGLAWHLQANHFPPVPTSMVDVCIAAIECIEDEDFDMEIQLPEGVTFRGRDSAPARDIFTQHHLEPWLSDEEEL